MERGFRAFISQEAFCSKFLIFDVLDTCCIVQKELNNILHRLNFSFIGELIVIFCHISRERNAHNIIRYGAYVSFFRSDRDCLGQSFVCSPVICTLSQRLDRFIYDLHIRRSWL